MVRLDLVSSTILVAILLALMSASIAEPVCTALIPYEERAKGLEPIAPLYDKTRKFHIGEFTIELEQDWARQGLSAVVWNAVSSLVFLDMQIYFGS